MAETQRPIRQMLTKLTFEANESHIDPFEAYALLMHRVGVAGLRADVYCSSSITSGGHARVPDLDIGSVIRRNTDTALDMVDELVRVGQLDPRSSVEAVALGKIRHWTQSDYMELWLSVMSGIEATGAGAAARVDGFRRTFHDRRDNHDTLDMAMYNNSAVSPAERATHYFTHAQTFYDLTSEVDHSPVAKLVRLVDPDQSLGAQTENVFARLQGTPVYNVAVAETGIRPNADHMPDRLVRDHDTIVAFGGAVFDTVRRQQLILVPHE